MTEEEYWFWLCTTRNMWQGKIDRLIKKFMTPERIFHAKPKQLAETKGINASDIKELLETGKQRDVTLELNKLDKRGISFIYYGNKLFPEKLYNLYDKPYGLFVKGRLPDPDKAAVAMVGARECSSYGKEIAGAIAGQLGRNGVQIISGLARGIDAYSQMGAISGGGTCFGILGCGIDICYPRENIDLYVDTIKCGGIISEYPPGVRPAAWQFPHRNRLISALCDKLVIVEAKEKSGSFITVEHALEQGKDVFAIPGRITDPLSAGCNRLIREGAQILTNINDLYGNMGCEPSVIQEKKMISLEKDFEVVYSNVDLVPKNIGQISKECGFNIRKTTEILVELELTGFIYEPIKTYYSRKL
ncbi:DNA-processing protein DprA [Parasporobacterium paucivorans]|uniref:DNA processing protein n=1 Tax=Parasporobacterium paucivorans DSM 15970 TaxID=1122934 RepID=A0A1M6G956_9FIRM|nr:DNA-processing protein DprA [Parasporobacterium paucivorans]SHJ06505.1 DNA processing protein [Parasporobacterium paucivorans DSM 15970]